MDELINFTFFICSYYLLLHLIIDVLDLSLAGASGRAVIAVTALEVNIAGRAVSREKKKNKKTKTKPYKPDVGARHWGIKHVVRTDGRTDGRSTHHQRPMMLTGQSRMKKRASWIRERRAVMVSAARSPLPTKCSE